METLTLERHAPRTAFLVTRTGNRLLEIRPASAEGGVDFEGRMERIVRALNVHDELVAVLRRAVPYLIDLVARTASEFAHGEGDAGDRLTLDAIDVVLAKAEGREP